MANSYGGAESVREVVHLYIAGAAGEEFMLVESFDILCQ